MGLQATSYRLPASSPVVVAVRLPAKLVHFYDEESLFESWHEPVANSRKLVADVQLCDTKKTRADSRSSPFLIASPSSSPA